MRDWIHHRIDTTSAGNANNNYRALQAWLGWLLREGEREHHPMQHMNPPNVPEQPIPVVPEDALARVLATCQGRDVIDRRDTAIIRFVFDTGARLSEIANLTVDDVDTRLNVIRVMGKGGKPRSVHESDPAARTSPSAPDGG